jgi:polysaccharide export outer membrane protein
MSTRAASLALASSLLLACGAKHVPPPIPEAPAALRTPGPEALVLGPGDRLSLRVWRQDDLTAEITIGPDGSFDLPLIGTVKAAGMTWPELKDTLTAAYAVYFQAPQVSLNLLEVQNQKVFVIGEVRVPSVLQISGEMSILEALTLTGGINESARTDNILLVRGGLDKPELYTIDLNTLFAGGSGSQIVALRRGDIIVVPTRTITSAGRYFKDVQTQLAPFLAGSAIYRNALSSGAQGTSSVLE